MLLGSSLEPTTRSPNTQQGPEAGQELAWGQAYGGGGGGREGIAHLVLLGELEAFIGFEALDVVSQVGDGDGRVVSHTWEQGGYMSRVSVRPERVAETARCMYVRI